MDLAWIDPTSLERETPRLAEILQACVLGGASVNFLLPYSLEAAEGFWRGSVAPSLARQERAVLVARIEGQIAGTVQLMFAAQPNQSHRADVGKLLVHPDLRRRGVAVALMRELERKALEHGRTLLTLDTESGSAAEPLYHSLGYLVAGQIPDFALLNDRSRFVATVLFYKHLQSS